MRPATVFFVALTALALGAASAASACVPISGAFRTQALPCPEAPALVCNYGEIDGDLVGSYVFRMHEARPSAEPFRTDYAGEVAYALGGGGMEGDDHGFFSADPSAPRFQKNVVFTGGDGAYAGAAGTLVGGGPIDWTTGRASGTYTGELCLPGA